MRVFISHQWRDKQVADQLQHELERAAGAEVWIDYRNLRPGDDIAASIERTLAETDVVLVLWSPHSAASSGVAHEVEHAVAIERRVIPCFLTYDDAGNVTPPLTGPLERFLGIDFHHFGTGLASLASLLVELKAERGGPDALAADDPRLRLLHRMREGATYLANYRNVKGVDDDRRYWVSQIVGELESYYRDTGDRELVGQFVGGLEAIRDDDPEAYEAAMERLAPVLGDVDPPPGAPLAPPTVDPQPTTGWHADPPSSDLLDQVLASADVAAGDRANIRSGVEAYCAAAEPALHAMAAAAAAAQSAAGQQVVQYLNGYLTNGDDLIPDHHGLYGQLDDAWLILNTAFRLIESGALTVAQVPIDWATITQVDAAVRALIPAPAMAALEQQMMQLLQLIANEIAAYQPWMNPTDTGYSPTMSWGNSWEDQMAQGLAELGLSF